MKTCCGTCRWAKWELTKNGNVSTKYAGRCVFPKPPDHPVPECENASTSWRGGIWRDFGQTCKVWMGKEERGGTTENCPKCGRPWFPEYGRYGCGTTIADDGEPIHPELCDVLAENAEIKKKLEHASAMSKAGMELAEYASYAEIVGMVHHNREQIRKWCDEIFRLFREERARLDAVERKEEL